VGQFEVPVSTPLRTFLQSTNERNTCAGFPPTRVFGGTSLVTTEPAATTEFSPTVTPPMMVTPAAIHTLFSITMGFPIVAARRSEGLRGWPVVMMLTFGPIITSSAMSRPPRSNRDSPSVATKRKGRNPARAAIQNDPLPRFGTGALFPPTLFRTKSQTLLIFLDVYA